MRNGVLAAIVGGLLLAAPAIADEDAPDSAGGRYTFNKVPDGFLRLDLQTGEVSLCSQRTVGWACQAAPEDRAVLESEIARLRNENAVLKKEMLGRGIPLPPGAMPEPPAVRNGDRTPRLGENYDVDRVMTLVNRMWHQLIDAIARAQKQIQNNKS